MPLYEYECLKNRHAFEVRQPITEDPVKECPLCGSEVRRIIHPVGIVFKGSGFYATDSRGKGVSSSHKPAETGGEAKASDSTGTSDSKPSGEGKTKKDSGGGESSRDSKAASSSQSE